MEKLIKSKITSRWSVLSDKKSNRDRKVTPSPAPTYPVTAVPVTTRVRVPAIIPIPESAVEATVHATPGDFPQSRIPHQTITSEELRDFRELLRQKYSLDFLIWRERDVPEWDRDLVEENMVKADAAMQKIRRTVEAWDDPDFFASAEDYNKMQVIKKRIEESSPRDWTECPPWQDVSRTSY